MKYRIERLNMHGDGMHPMRVYDMPPATVEQRVCHHTFGGRKPDEWRVERLPDYWAAVTDVPCPRDKCAGTIRWHEAGYVPGYRICDSCGRTFFARGSVEKPTLILDGK